MLRSAGNFDDILMTNFFCGIVLNMGRCEVRDQIDPTVIFETYRLPRLPLSRCASSLFIHPANGVGKIAKAQILAGNCWLLT
jgi:hypothetical protein